MASTTDTNQFISLVEKFNSISNFRIIEPSTPDTLARVSPFADKVSAVIKSLERYQSIRNKGYSDDHLATEIGLFVLHINQVINNVADPSIMNDY